MNVLCYAMRRASSMLARPRLPIGTANAIGEIPPYEFVKPARPESLRAGSARVVDQYSIRLDSYDSAIQYSEAP